MNSIVGNVWKVEVSPSDSMSAEGIQWISEETGFYYIQGTLKIATNCIDSNLGDYPTIIPVQINCEDNAFKILRSRRPQIAAISANRSSHTDISSSIPFNPIRSSHLLPNATTKEENILPITTTSTTSNPVTPQHSVTPGASVQGSGNNDTTLSLAQFLQPPLYSSLLPATTTTTTNPPAPVSSPSVPIAPITTTTTTTDAFPQSMFFSLSTNPNEEPTESSVVGMKRPLPSSDNIFQRMKLQFRNQDKSDDDLREKFVTDEAAKGNIITDSILPTPINKLPTNPNTPSNVLPTTPTTSVTPGATISSATKVISASKSKQKQKQEQDILENLAYVNENVYQEFKRQNKLNLLHRTMFEDEGKQSLKQNLKLRAVVVFDVESKDDKLRKDVPYCGYITDFKLVNKEFQIYVKFKDEKKKKNSDDGYYSLDRLLLIYPEFLGINIPRSVISSMKDKILARHFPNLFVCMMCFRDKNNVGPHICLIKPAKEDAIFHYKVSYKEDGIDTYCDSLDRLYELDEIKSCALFTLQVGQSIPMEFYSLPELNSVYSGDASVCKFLATFGGN